MDKFDVRHFKTERIDSHTRFYIMTHLNLKSWIDNPDTLKRIIDGQPRNANVHCAALCLYANMIQTNVFENEIDKLKPTLSLSDEEIIDELYKKPKYANYTHEQMQEELKQIICVDIRNAFAHGLFAISCPNKNPKNGVFVLEPNRSVINSINDAINSAKNTIAPYRIAIPFEQIQKLLHQYIAMQSIKALHTTDYVKKAITEKRGESIDEFLIPATLCSMADHYMEPTKIDVMKSLTNPLVQGYAQNALSIATLVYEQNSHYALEGKDDELFALESFIRNSTIHHNTHLDADGTTQTIVDPEKTDESDIVQDDFVTISKVMELFHAQMHIFNAKIKSGEITQEQYANMSVTDRLQYVVDQIKDLEKDDNDDKHLDK